MHAEWRGGGNGDDFIGRDRTADWDLRRLANWRKEHVRGHRGLYHVGLLRARAGAQREIVGHTRHAIHGALRGEEAAHGHVVGAVDGRGAGHDRRAHRRGSPRGPWCANHTGNGRHGVGPLGGGERADRIDALRIGGAQKGAARVAQPVGAGVGDAAGGDRRADKVLGGASIGTRPGEHANGNRGARGDRTGCDSPGRDIGRAAQLTQDIGDIERGVAWRGG